MEAKDVWVFPNVSSEKQRYYYCKESFFHPAKMPTYLAQKIIKEYSKPGDLILDPMTGIGTTLVEAVLLGRNAIGVEYEKKFVDVVEHNLKGIEVFRPKIQGMGHAKIIQGDSRKLSELLGEKATQSAFSPPYAHESYVQKHQVVNPSPFIKRIQAQTKGTNYMWRAENYGESKENIGNLTYNSIDEVIMSPPFSEINHKTNYLGKQKKESGTEYSDDKNNIGNLKRGNIDAIITSPPFSSSLAEPANDDTSKFKHGSAGKDYSENKQDKEQLANLEYGKIDSIITSPPFEKNITAVSTKFAENHPTRKRNNFGVYENINYSDNKEDYSNLANLNGVNYLTEMLKVYKQCFAVLKEGGLMVLVTKNFTRKGKIVRLDLDTIKLVENCHKDLFCKCGDTNA